jgi:hypothetical protein
MILSKDDYEVIICNQVSKLAAFTKPTSLPYDYLKQQCLRMIEILDEYKDLYRDAKHYGEDDA